MKKLERLPGFYWVWLHVQKEWTVAEYDNTGDWWFIGNDSPDILTAADVIGEQISRNKIDTNAK